jgi:hypothetical protein
MAVVHQVEQSRICTSPLRLLIGANIGATTFSDAGHHHGIKGSSEHQDHDHALRRRACLFVGALTPSALFGVV